MSFQYDQYLARHRANVKRGFDWLSENLPGLMTNTLTAGWNTEFAHDQSKNEPDEYEAYDAFAIGTLVMSALKYITKTLDENRKSLFRRIQLLL